MAGRHLKEEDELFTFLMKCITDVSFAAATPRFEFMP